MKIINLVEELVLEVNRKNVLVNKLGLSPENAEIVRESFRRAKVDDRAEVIVGPALDMLPTIERNGPFDFVFIDADKKNYCTYYDLVFDKVRPGGYIIADNVLWSGKVLEEYETLDRETKIIMDYNRMVHEDSRVQEVLLPIRDGLMVARKR